MIRDDEVFAADLDRRLGHLADRRATIRREGVRVKVAAQRLAEGRRTLFERLVLGECLEAAQVDRLLAAQALEDRALGDLADPAQASQAAVAASRATSSGPSSVSVAAAPRKARMRYAGSCIASSR